MQGAAAGALPNPDVDRIAYVCEHHAVLRELLERTGDASRLDQILMALRDDEAACTSELLDELHDALQEVGDAVGIPGSRRSLIHPTGLPSERGIPAVHHNEIVFLCPGDRCSRYWWPPEDPDSDTDETAPNCAVSGSRLRWETF